MVFLLKCLFVWILVISATFGQNACPVTNMPEWPTGNESTDYFDNTLNPSHEEEWRVMWMSQLDDDHHFNDVTIPGTHQSFSHYWTTWAQCNTWSLTDQLQAGLRYFDVRTDQINDELSIWHGIISQHNCLDNVIEELLAFLETNPTEFIMMRLDNYDSRPDGHTLTFTEAVWNITDQYSQEYFWKESVFPSTIGDARGKLIIFHNWDDPGMWGPQYGDNSVIEDEYVVENRGDLDAKWDGIVEHLNAVPDGDLNAFCIMYNSGAGVLWTPERVAGYTNMLMHEHLLTLERPSRRGVILFDFPGYDIIGDVIKFNGNFAS